MSEVKKVSLRVRAIEKGYVKGKIIEVGEEFLFEGVLSTSGKLPLWTEAVDKEAFTKATEVKQKIVKAAPVVEEKTKENIKVDEASLPAL